MLKKVILGFFAGLVSGLFATGGGLILVPAFVYLLKETEVSSRATSIFCILPLVIISGVSYYTNNYILVKFITEKNQSKMIDLL